MHYRYIWSVSTSKLSKYAVDYTVGLAGIFFISFSYKIYFYKTWYYIFLSSCQMVAYNCCTCVCIFGFFGFVRCNVNNLLFYLSCFRFFSDFIWNTRDWCVGYTGGMGFCHNKMKLDHFLHALYLHMYGYQNYFMLLFLFY